MSTATESIFLYDAARPLLFTGLNFWIFFLALLVGYALLVKRITLRNVYLLFFSLFFYYKSCGLFFLLILLSIAVNFYAAKLIDRLSSRAWRKTVLSVGVALNLSLLAYFKYSNFLVDAVNQLFGTQYTYTNAFGTALASLFGDDPSLSGAVLPVGISFYTFQAISYIVDVYRQKVSALSRVSDFGLYLSFFPALVAGPIVRAAEFIPQIHKPYNVSSREQGHALYLILIGLFKKVVLSDYIALNLVDRIFNNPTAYTGVENLLAAYGYTLQIYCDFSGYTDIAIGLALLLGFRLTINFNFPYRAATLTDFWRRWHISLSSWLRDYLYIPLGGNRHGRLVMWGSLMTTMLLGGLWHGAHWHFVFWGGMHGLGLILSKGVDKLLPERMRSHRLVIGIRFLVTFHFVVLLWVFFRASSFGQAGQILHQIAFEFNPHVLWQALYGYRVSLLLMLLGYLLHWVPSRWIEQLRGAFIQSPVWAKGVICILVALLVINVQGAGLQPFIYFDF